MGVSGGRTPDSRMSLVEHLKEFRRRLTWSLVAVVLGIALTFVYWEPVYDVLRQPYCQTHPRGGCQLYAYGIFEQFNTKMKVALIGGTVLSSPVWLYQIGAFITPALHKKERRYAGGFLVGALVLFLSGVTVAYFSLSYGLHVLLNVAGNNVQSLPSVKDYLSFVTLLMVLFGLAFQFPVIIMFLNITGILSATRMRAWRRQMAFGIFAASAVLTPSTDPFQFILLGIPLYGLYEVCIVIARLRERSQRRKNGPTSTLDDDLPSYVDTTPSPLT